MKFLHICHSSGKLLSVLNSMERMRRKKKKNKCSLKSSTTPPPTIDWLQSHKSSKKSYRFAGFCFTLLFWFTTETFVWEILIKIIMSRSLLSRSPSGFHVVCKFYRNIFGTFEASFTKRKCDLRHHFHYQVCLLLKFHLFARVWTETEKHGVGDMRWCT